MNAALKVCPQCGTEYPANARFCEVDGTALRSAVQGNDLVGSIVAERYHVMKKLGEGGMGQVYLAEHVKMGRKSALKVMHPGMKSDVDAISRFNREAANASRIAHPNVAAVYDFGETTDGIIFLAMEFVDGPPLTSILEQQGALAPLRAADIVRQTADALAVAHDMGIVHRDLKPDNIMVAKRRDGADFVKVVDFGIAKAAGNEAQKVTKTGLVVGTPEYMSPEQLAGDALDGRSDIYSLGLVAFKMLTGQLPFPGETAQDAMIMRLTDKPKRLDEMKPDRAWPADVQAVMDKALERDANARFQTATEFGVALFTAIQRMPETSAAAAGTAMMAAVPATRVSSAATSIAEVAALAQSPAGTQTVDAPKKSAPPVPPGTAKTRDKSKIPALAGGVAGLVVVGAVVAKLALGAGGGAKPVDTTAAVQSGANTASNTTPVVQAPGTSLATVPSTIADTGSKSSVGIDGPPAVTPTAGPAAPSTPKPTLSLSDQLRALVDDSRNPATGQSVLDQVARLEPRLRQSGDWLLATQLKANVLNERGDTNGACQALKAWAGHLNRDDLKDLKSRWEDLLPTCDLE